MVTPSRGLLLEGLQRRADAALSDLALEKNTEIAGLRAALRSVQQETEDARNQKAQVMHDLKRVKVFLDRANVLKVQAERKARRFQAELLLAIGEEGESV